jgi:hypothetical protein
LHGELRASFAVARCVLLALGFRLRVVGGEHVRAAYDKLGASSRTEAVLVALRRGLVSLA